MRALDLFAGPGGWDEGLRPFGIAPLGVEWDDDACATRLAAGHPTLQANVAELDPQDFAGTELLLASPPCQAFSIAGKKRGHVDRDIILEVMVALAAGRDLRADHSACVADSRSLLVVEPLRFALALRPRFVAFEQVPPVLPLWERTAELLEEVGYSTWTGVLSAEEFGVPQTRKRAILIASLDGPVAPPAPTHHAYNPRKVESGRESSNGLLPWVSMAEALDWEESDLVGFPRRADTPSNAAGENVVDIDGTKYRGRDLRATSEPSFNLTGKVRSWSRFRPSPTIVTTRRSKDGLLVGRSLPRGEGVNVGGHGWTPSTDPLGLKGEDWPARRPSTTVAGDSRIFQPGGHHKPGEQSRNAIRVTVAEAGVLQTFPADYPWQGSRTSQCLQVGNAMPPLLAHAVVAALLKRAS